MLNRATAQSFLPATFQIATFLAARRPQHRRLIVAKLRPPLYLSPIAVPGTPGQVVVRTLYVTPTVRTRVEAQRRMPHSRLRGPRAVFVRVTPL